MSGSLYFYQLYIQRCSYQGNPVIQMLGACIWLDWHYSNAETGVILATVPAASKFSSGTESCDPRNPDWQRKLVVRSCSFDVDN